MNISHNTADGILNLHI